MNDSPTRTLPAAAAASGPAVARSLLLRESLRDMAPALCLVTTLGAAGLLYWGGGAAGGQAIGFAQTTAQAAAPVEPGRVSAILVEVGDRVEAGQVVATLDTSTLDAEIAVAEAQRAQIEAEARAEQAVLTRELDQEVEGLERESARLREEQLRVTAEAKALDGEVSRVKRLVEERQAVLDDLTQLGLRQASATALAAAKPRTIGLLKKQIDTAEERRKQARDDKSALATKLAAGLLVAERNIELLRRRREGYSLRAVRAGRVAAILRRPGDVVEGGHPIVQIVTAEDRVTACIPEQSALAVREGDGAALRVRGQSGAALHGRAVALGPLVTELPARCWASPKVPVWGREVTIALDRQVELVPGQAFEITFEPAHGGPPSPAPPVASAPVSAAATAAVSGGGAPRPMTVPPALSIRTRFEPSGVLAREAEGRYLVVSDDTGRAGDEGEPWLFAMAASGAVESEPVVVSGVREIDDVEAIAAGGAGEVYLLASQSHSKKGKRKPARTALLRSQPEGRGLRVDGEVHLAEQLDADPELAAALGLPEGTGALDIEGLGFRDGALYLGVKAPLDARGDAMIWRVASPAALFGGAPGGGAGGRTLRDAGIARWASVRVDVEMDGQATPGGISDLLFLPGGPLVIASTPSTAEGAAGALWIVDRPDSGTLSPRLIRRFPGLKPEGVSVALGAEAAAGKLMVVFDTGEATPLFQEIPWGP